MKKLILVVVAMLCLLSQTDAQVRFGLKVGVDFDDFAHVKQLHSNNVGWQAGPMLQLMLPVVGMGAQAEALITQKRVDILTPGGGLSNSRHSMWYLQVPVHFRYELNLILLRPFFTAGPQFRWAIDKSGEYKSDFNDFDWGIGLGGGIEILKFQVGLRYTWGIKDSGAMGDINPNTFTLSLGRLF